MQQLPLIPISPLEFRESAYRLAILLTEMDDAEALEQERRKAHKEHMGALRREAVDLRTTIRRAQLEAEEGLMQSQVDALLNQEEEQR